MLLFTLLACYERVVMDARIDVPHQTVRVLSQQQGLDNQVGGASACGDAAACVAAIEAQLAEDRTQLAAASVTDLRNGVWIRDGELDLVSAYTAPFTSSLFEGGAPLRLLPQQVRGRSRPVMGLLVAPDGADVRATATATGPYTVLSLSDAGNLYLFPKGKPRVHFEHQNRSEGEDVVIEPWVASVPGLVEALGAKGLLLDPASVLP